MEALIVVITSVVIIGIILIAVFTRIGEKFDIPLVCAAVCIAIGGYGSAAYLGRTEYVELEIDKIVHYQAYNEEEINKVWIKDKDGMYFYVLMSDRQFFKYRTQKENGEVVLRIKRLEFNEEIICSKKREI